MKTIKVGTIGYGGAFNMGKQHLEMLNAHEGFVPTAVCDLDPERVKVAESDWPGIQIYTDLDELLAKSDVELLVNILPHNAHAPITVKCLEAGRHMVVEKPFAITTDECDAMIDAARRNNRVLSTFHNRHWDPLPLTLTKHLDKIGRPYRFEANWGGHNKPRDWWRSDKEISGGIIYDWGAHIMEWMLQVMPYEMTEISGYGVNEVWDYSNEDELEAVVRFGDKGVSSLTVTSLAMEGKPMFRLVGTEGAFVGNPGSVELVNKNAQGELVRTKLHMEKGEQHKYYENLHNHFQTGEPLVITPEWARRVIQILDYAGKSFEQGKALVPKYA